MPAPAAVSELDAAVLERHYDDGSIERGRTYAGERRIQLLGADPGAIKAVCRGSGNASYLVRVRWEGVGGGIAIDDSCTCPLASGCKHCVAAILTAQAESASADGPGAAAAARSHAPNLEWRRVLGALATSDGDVDPLIEGLALQFDLHHPPRSRHTASSEPTLTIRPMRPGRAGRWIKSGASWRDVTSSYSYRLDDADPRHLAVLRALMASATRNVYPDDQPLAVDRFGPDLWHQLRRAQEVGMALIGPYDEPVELSAVPAVAEVDLVARADGAVAIASRITIDGEALGATGGGGGLVGTPAHGLWVSDEHHRLRLAPFDEPLHAAVTQLVSTGTVVVPADDVDELLDRYQPVLARHAKVGSSDGSVTITTAELDRIVLVIHRPALDAASLHWTARYRRGDRTIDHPLLVPRGSQRDRAAEAVAIADLTLPTHLLPTLGDDDGPRDLELHGPDVAVLLTDVVPWLRTIGGIDVEVHGDQPELHRATEDPLISLTITDGEARGRRDGNDWFDLGVEVSIEGEAVDFASLFAALDAGAPALILPSGIVLDLDRPDFDRLRELIEEARGLIDPAGDGVARINRFQASWWDELVGLGVVAEQSERWAAGIEAMAALSSPEPVPAPAGLEATLRPYQQEGLDWLAFLHRNRLGGILGDDMGLGKTVQTLAMVLHILEARPDARFLVVAPTSVVENWAREARRFAPGIEVATIGETTKRRGAPLADAIGSASLVVTSYALFRIDIAEHEAIDWEVLLLDEAQFVKNHNSKAYQCARRLDAPTKIAMTGTPMENSLMDLWSLLSITAPGLYPDPKRFSDTYRKPIESGEAPELLATLRRRIAPLLRRRTKDAVLHDLPPKTELTVDVELSPRHARIYATQLQRQRQKVLGLVGDVTKNRFEILKSLTLLRQLALDPGLVDDGDDDVGSAKLDRLLDDLEQVVAEGHRALVFSQFTRYLARVRTRLDEAGIDHSYLDGSTKDRAGAIEAFTDGDAPVFVISLKAGGFGLNLTQADYCFILDPWWNPATETQAVDRTHRIGQQNPVMVYRYVSVDTIEEKVMELKARKASLFASVMDADGALSGALSEDDIRGLLDLGP